MNKVFLSGYIASEIELKTTPNSVPVTSFSLAVKRPHTKEETTDFISVICWRNTAEFVCRNFRKGSGIEVSGMLTVRKWQDKNDNTRYSTEVVVDEVDFGKRSKVDAEAEGEGGNKEKKDKRESPLVDADDDDYGLQF